ncbi:tellurite resistance TerB family protein [Chelatococcus asaccharovorans]|uniref:tellurite resistance TerB family protein n=1 Tax=Chelatococcus asaccharovorans TaxID=28210 RepID=UPI00224C7662|nr:TerB family tellurite resistance protein [Chelatococcus asaccharovorans]CAH1661526.1 putative tellurite resistance protein B-like protein [Chelatococcus asaccharovorans]CAH1683445.1 putative tellurite resistance protein B-like protein [Chelatococcus asaccharovorans]
MTRASPHSPLSLVALVRELAERVGGADDGETSAADSDGRLALATLLVHVARIDGIMVPAEWARLETMLRDEFALTAADAEALAVQGDLADRGNADVQILITPLRRRLDVAARTRLLHLAWDLAQADGEVRELEDDLIWRLARLLDLDETVVAGLRRSSPE